MEEMIAGDRAILRANESYWGGAPSIDRLEFIYFDDQQAGIAAVQGGSVDGIACAWITPASSASAAM